MPKFVPRQRKQKHRRQESAAPVDTNATELAPVSKDEKEARRQKLREELREQNTNVSSKKQKRLDKYIVCEPGPTVCRTDVNLLRRKTNLRKKRTSNFSRNSPKRKPIILACKASETSASGKDKVMRVLPSLSSQYNPGLPPLQIFRDMTRTILIAI